MCKTDQNNTAQVQKPQPDPQIDQSDEVKLANIALREAEIRANIAFNSSPAGQMMRQFETYQRIAQPLSQADFVPQAYKNNLANCMIAVEIAARIGVFPLTVMQNLCIVNGNPKWFSKFLIACVNQTGRYTTLNYHFGIDGNVGEVMAKTWVKDEKGKGHEAMKPFEYPMLDNLTCVAFATEKATGTLLESPPVSIRMAVQEGWYTKSGSKWPSMPELMLRYRAAAFWVSTYAPEIGMGFGTAEEARDIVDVEYEDVTETSNQRPRSIRPSNIDEAKEKLRQRAQKNDQQPKTDMP